MTHHTSPSTSSTPTGPLILFLALCLLFQLPAFTKATTPTPSITFASTLQEPQTPPQAHQQIKINVDSDHTHELRAAAPDPEPQFLTITATGVYSQQPQYTPYTYTSVQPQVIVTQYVTPVTTTYYTSQQQPHTTTTTLPAGFIAAGGYYCSTLYAQGDGLPTTRQGNCGTILVESSPVAAQPSNSGAGAKKVGGEGVIGGGKSMLAMVLVLAIGVAGLG